MIVYYVVYFNNANIFKCNSLHLLSYHYAHQPPVIANGASNLSEVSDERNDLSFLMILLYSCTLLILYFIAIFGCHVL